MPAPRGLGGAGTPDGRTGPAGIADARFLDFLQVLLGHVVGRQATTPLPTSLLLDSSGQLVAVYLGRLDVDALLADVALVSRLDPGDLSDVNLTPGTLAVDRKRPYGLLNQELRRIGRDDLVEFYKDVARRR